MNRMTDFRPSSTKEPLKNVTFQQSLNFFYFWTLAFLATPQPLFSFSLVVCLNGEGMPSAGVYDSLISVNAFGHLFARSRVAPVVGAEVAQNTRDDYGANFERNKRYSHRSSYINVRIYGNGGRATDYKSYKKCFIYITSFHHLFLSTFCNSKIVHIVYISYT